MIYRDFPFLYHRSPAIFWYSNKDYLLSTSQRATQSFLAPSKIHLYALSVHSIVSFLFFFFGIFFFFSSFFNILVQRPSSRATSGQESSKEIIFDEQTRWSRTRLTLWGEIEVCRCLAAILIAKRKTSLKSRNRWTVRFVLSSLFLFFLFLLRCPP